MNRQSALVVGTVLAGGLLLVGCTSAEAPEPAPIETTASTGNYEATVKQAAAATEAAETARVSGDVEAVGVGTDTSLSLSGAIDFKSGNFQGTLASDLFGTGTEVQIRLVDGNAYAQVPLLGDSWIEAPTGSGVGLGVASDQLDILRKIADVEEVGQETIDGTTATHYRGTLKLAKALQSLGLDPDQLAGAEGALQNLDSKAVIDLWIDDQDRIVKLAQEISGKTSEGATAGVTSVIEFSNFGVEVNVKPPAKDEILDLDDLGGLVPTP